MKIDETELIEFFGVAPLSEDPEEKEFFGSSTFEVSDGEFKLLVHFGSHHGDMSIMLFSATRGDPVVQARLGEISEVRVLSNPKILEVVGKARGAKGNDPQIKQRVTIARNPLEVKIED